MTPIAKDRLADGIDADLKEIVDDVTALVSVLQRRNDDLVRVAGYRVDWNKVGEREPKVLYAMLYAVAKFAEDLNGTPLSETQRETIQSYYSTIALLASDGDFNGVRALTRTGEDVYEMCLEEMEGEQRD